MPETNFDDSNHKQSHRTKGGETAFPKGNNLSTVKQREPNHVVIAERLGLEKRRSVDFYSLTLTTKIIFG